MPELPRFPKTGGSSNQLRWYCDYNTGRCLYLHSSPHGGSGYAIKAKCQQNCHKGPITPSTPPRPQAPITPGSGPRAPITPRPRAPITGGGYR